ncbi:thiamine pyrophosphate-dependent enzyme [Kitasatospora sp. NPDC001574]
MEAAPRKLSTGEAIVDALIAHGTDTLFGIPGVQTYALFEALADRSDEIRVIGARHEQACAYMAFGYAQSSGRVGACSVVPGPGVLNAGAALLTALGASTPVVCVTSEIPSHAMGRGLGHLHEMPDQLATLRSVTKWSKNILHPTEAADTVGEAFRQARSGRPGPVAVAAPWDVLTQTAAVRPAEVQSWQHPPLDDGAIRAAAELLAGARNPMILVGGGARDADADVLVLAEKLQAPVVAFRSGLGIAPKGHPLSFTCAEGFERWPETDVYLAVGTRQELAWFRWPDKPAGVKSINIDIDPRQHIRLEPDIAITADAGNALTAISELVPASTMDRTDEFQKVRTDVRREVETLQPHVDYLDTIRAELPRDGFFVEEISQIGFSSYFAFDVHAPRHLVTSGHQGTLGFGFPTALGVKVANPDKAVVSVTGDGGFLFGVQELATAVQHDIGVVVIVFNNNAFGNVKADQLRLYGRESGATLKNPDFVALAQSFGAHGYRVGSPVELRSTLRHAIAEDRPAVIEVCMPLVPEVNPWRFLMPGSRR